MPLVLVEYEMIIANKVRRRLTISYAMRARGMFVKYEMQLSKF